MPAFDAHNTEAWVSYLGATREEFVALQELVSSYRRHCGEHGIPLVIVDQSRAIREEMWELGSRDGAVLLPLHERQKVELVEPDLSLEEIRDALDELASDELVRVRTTKQRFFHSQCINSILQEWGQTRFVLLFDSDTLIIRDGLLDDLAAAYPVSEWDSITAAGSVVDFVDSTRRLGFKRRVRRWLGLDERVGRDYARRWRLPRLHPYCLLINRDLVREREMDFRLLFLDVLEAGWVEDSLRAGRFLGDTGASLVMHSAYHGLRIGDFPMGDYVTHGGRASHRPPANRKLQSLNWW